MSGYWITLNERTTAGAAPSAAPSRSLADAAAALLGCTWSGWVADATEAWEVVFRALGIGAGRSVVHATAPPAPLDRALAATECQRLEVDVSPLTAAPDWPTALGAVVVLDHRHALPQVPPDVIGGAGVAEDATTAIGGSVHGRPVGALGDLVVVALGTPLCPRSSGAIVATAHRRWAGVLGGDAALARLSDLGDPAVGADLRALPDRLQGFRAAADVYDSAWRDKGLDLSVIAPARGATSARSEYLIRVSDPDGLVSALAAEGIEARRPLHDRARRLLERPDETYGGAREFYRHALQLPSHPGLDLGDLLYVADVTVRHLRASHA